MTKFELKQRYIDPSIDALDKCFRNNFSTQELAKLAQEGNYTVRLWHSLNDLECHLCDPTTEATALETAAYRALYSAVKIITY